MSAVFTGKKVWILEGGAEIDNKDVRKRPENATSKTPIYRVEKVHAIDVVDAPAANADGVFGAFAGTTNIIAAKLFAQLDRITADIPYAELLAIFHRFNTDHQITHPALATFTRETLTADFGTPIEAEQKAKIFAANYLQHHQLKAHHQHQQTTAAAPISLTYKYVRYSQRPPERGRSRSV
jgi:hypothetical protein